MSGKIWAVALGMITFWLIGFILIAQPTDSALNDCITNAKAADNALAVTVQGVTGPETLRVVRPYEQLCSQYLDNRQTQLTTFGLLSSILALLALCSVHVFLRRRQQRAILIDTIKSQARTEVIMGDVFNNISNSSIINRTQLKGSMEQNHQANPELSAALAAMAMIVIKSKNKDAEEHLNKKTE